MKRILLLCCLCFLGCAAQTTTQVKPCATPSLESKWHSQPGTFRLRHDGVLTLGSRTIPMSGLMDLDIARQRASVVIFTGLGIKLAAIDFHGTSWTPRHVGPLAQHIPHFMEQCAASIQAMFLTGFPQATDACSTDGHGTSLTGKHLGGTIQTDLDDEGHLVGKTLTSHENNWRVTYSDFSPMNNIEFPKDVTFISKDRPFTVQLKLTDAKRL